MRLRVKVILCVLLLVFAAVSLAAVLADLGVLPRAEPAQAEGAYGLREWEGFVGVFSPPEADSPAIMTDIRVRDLPLSDELALAVGITVPDYEQVVRLLEDMSR